MTVKLLLGTGVGLSQCHIVLDACQKPPQLGELWADGSQHKGAMSTKPVFEKIAKIQRSYVPLCGHTTFVVLTLARIVSIIDKIRIFCNDVNKISTSVE